MAYPEVAGWKATETSRDAAESTEAATAREMVVDAFEKHGSHTADEMAFRLRLSPLSIRPRISELRAFDQIRDTGVRRKNASWKRAIVWELVPRSTGRV